MSAPPLRRPEDVRRRDAWRRSDRSAKRVPAEEGFWVIIFGDLAVFTAFFGTYLYYRGRQPAMFARAQQDLTVGFGLVNTLVLLTGSLLVSIGVRAVRSPVRSPNSRMAVARPAFAGAIGCGVAFVCLKAVEWGLKFHDGRAPTTNSFFMYYFVLTGLHLFHVLIGIAGLCYLFTRAKDAVVTPKRLVFIEAGASFWHLVDLLWIVLFPLLYLVR